MTKNQPELKACELLPCPFCGSKPNYIAFGNDQHQIDCENPDCKACAGTPTRPTKELCFNAWNARPSPIIPEDTVQPVTDDALQEAVERISKDRETSIHVNLWRDIETLINHAMKGQIK